MFMPPQSPVDTSAPTVDKPVESSSVEVSKDPIVDETNVVPLTTDDAFPEYIDCWCKASEDIDFKCVTKRDSKLHDQGYLCTIQIDNVINKKVNARRYFYFQGAQDSLRRSFAKLDKVKYCLAEELYDHRLFKLCNIIKRSWFNDTDNLWNLACMLYRKQHVSLGLMRKTYLCVLKTMTDKFNASIALKVFNDFKANNYHPKLTESQLKSIAGGTNPKAFNEWKAEYEPKEIKQTEKKKDKESTQIEFPRFNIHHKKGELPPIFDCKVSESYLDVIDLKKKVITVKRLYHFVKDNIAYILHGGNGYYLTKNKYAFGMIEYEVVRDIRQFDMMFYVSPDEEVEDDQDREDAIKVVLMEAVGHYRDDITFGRVDFVPYNAKTGVCVTKLNTFDWNSNQVFNKFNGFVHKYDPNFIVDKSKFDCFASHIKEIWSDGQDDMLQYIMKLFAWYVQRPYQKTGACVVLEGEEGCGKNIIFEVLTNHVIGKQYCLETPKIKLLTARVNAKSILTVLNEAANVNKSSHEDQEELKDCITEPTCEIERKGIDSYKVKDCNNIFIASNNSYSVKAFNRMRRFVYLVLKNDRTGDEAYFDRILEQFNNADGGIHLYHHLMSIDLNGFHPQNHAPMIRAKSEMQKSAIEKPIKWLVECVTNGTHSNVFTPSQIDITPDREEFVSINFMLNQFTKWMIEEAKDVSSYSKERFSKTLSKVLGPNHKKQNNGVRERGYELSVADLKEKIAVITRRDDLFA
ncbi:TPA: LOW QUALITY PROTEIN: hypothetical protein N0F65_010361 [Lagenidium giganteum]|uniref:NrS-1 polymerase-like helicase domain-containing protein n=1 Tax=Lagenidium giganteum TaxID=4803 RepID=A0AAV2Z770_9STRA|nr:TPA: LOW QUALITY PROTEIN: hypothetical protein N0F65_010361 [Lagenidium giganteum]